MSDPTLEDRLVALERRMVDVERLLQSQRPIAPAVPTAKPQTLREYLRDKNPKTGAEKAVVAARWLELNGTTPINAADLVRAFGDAKEALPENPADLLYKNGKRGFMAPSKEKKGGTNAWFVTNTGEKFVDGGLKV